ncbi:UNVERIFIED_CONTAM: hypothetical protein GTU68_057414 [Idotea baltica]|nr:hypothetical protein [Idotea baltica]
MVMVASDRISAFDVILPRPIPFKGQILNQTAAFFLQSTEEIAPNHFISTPDPNVTLCHRCKPIPIEMVIRGYLCGHAWRIYKEGGREICGVTMPDGLRQYDPFPEPILTPATKSTIGHDEDISEADILKSGLVAQDAWAKMHYYAFALYKRGAEMALEKGLILADTKYEFGYQDGDDIVLIDEVHTPDSSRYLYADGYQERQDKGETQKQLSKEFVREWLMANGFQGLDGQKMPDMTEEVLSEITARYTEVYETLTGQKFIQADTTDIEKRIQTNVNQALKAMGLEGV